MKLGIAYFISGSILFMVTASLWMLLLAGPFPPWYFVGPMIFGFYALGGSSIVLIILGAEKLSDAYKKGGRA